jgi:hypothetical protein
MTLNNLAMLLSERRMDEALELVRRAHETFRSTLGAAHPHTVTAGENHALLAAKSREKEAESGP